MFFFFFDNENKSNDKQIELHYLSNSISYGVDKIDGKKFFDSHGKLEKRESEDGSQNEFKESEFKQLISEKIRKTIYGEKYSNIVFLAGAGASVVGGNPKYGKTVRMIADDIFEKLHDIDEFYTLEELAKMCRYKDGNILDSVESESSGTPELDKSFNLEDFLSTLFHYRPYVSENDKESFNNTVQKILELIKENTNYSYDSRVLKHGALLKLLSDLSGKDGNKFSVITTIVN